jgi:hypothetical protein
VTALAFDDDGVDVVYEGIEFRLDRSLIEEATRKDYPDVTDHEVLALVADDDSNGEPRRVADILA